MLCRLLLAAALLAAAAAVGEYKVVLGGSCGCGINGAGIQTYNLATAAYCPTSSYPSCNVTKMVEQECTISCSGPRAVLVYRNNSAVWSATSSISCVKNADGVTTQLSNALGQSLFNLQRPTCAYKAPCNACNVTYQPTCPAGMTCKATNLEHTTAADDCGRLTCKTGTLKLYNGSGAPIDYSTKELFCTVVGKWTNYSFDGSIVGGNIISDPFTANCILPKACEECLAPKTADTLMSLPSTFHTGYNIAPASQFKEAASCSEFTCPAGFTLYGFSGNSTTVTGLEYTNKGTLKCDGNSRWTNGGYESSPNNLFVACLQSIPQCTTCAPNLIAVTTGIYGKTMDADHTTMTDGCAQRTFTCNGYNAAIYVFGAGGQDLGSAPDEGSGSATFPVACNAAGTAWEAAGYTITRVECNAFPEPTCPALTHFPLDVCPLLHLTNCYAADLTPGATLCPQAGSKLAVEFPNGQTTRQVKLECIGTDWWIMMPGSTTLKKMKDEPTMGNPTTVAILCYIIPVEVCPPLSLGKVEACDPDDVANCFIPEKDADGILRCPSKFFMILYSDFDLTQIGYSGVECRDGKYYALKPTGDFLIESDPVLYLACSNKQPEAGCQVCKKDLVKVTSDLATWTDEIDSTGDCALLKMTCVADQGGRTVTVYINGNPSNEISPFTISATCSADGTSWISGGTSITTIECEGG